MILGRGDAAVVTGASSGIGRALAIELARRGVALLLADIDAEELESAAAEARELDVDVLSQIVDVRDYAAVSELPGVGLSAFGRIDAVFNNAGVLGRRAYLWEHESNDWRWIHEVNVFGVMNGIRAFVPHFIESGRGHVINTSSIAGMGRPGAGHGAYTASKHAIVALSEVLRFELDQVAPDVGVTVLCPGRFASRIRDTERNRPTEFSTPSSLATPIVSVFDSVEPLPAETFAAHAMAGVDAGRLYVPIGPGTVESAIDHAHDVIDSIT